jgi:hypothetical protein
MAYEPATAQNRPGPVGDETRERWDWTAIGHAMLIGRWKFYGDRRLREFFGDEAVEFQPDIVTAICLLRTFTEQTSTLYDGAVTVHMGDVPDESRAMLGLDLLWAQQQQTLEYVRGLNDSLLLRSWDNEHKRVRYLPVAPDYVEAWPDPSDPSQPGVVHHHQQRPIEGRMVWCRDVWDRAGRTFKIEAHAKVEGQGSPWVDVTDTVSPELKGLPGRYPFWTHPPPDGAAIPEGHDFGDPIWPWTAYHHRVGWKLFDAWYNSELVDLTLLVAVMLTYGICAARDVAFEVRVLMDGKIPGTNTPGPNGTPHTAISPLKVLLVKSEDPTHAARIDSWEKPIDIADFFGTIGQLMTLGAMAAGLSGADVATSESGLSRVSGEAITVSRGGQRKIEKKMVKPMALGDAHNLAGAAALATAYGEAKGLPLDPEDFGIVYAETPRTVEEVKAEVDEITTTVEAGLLHPAKGIRRLAPHLTDDEAKAEALAIAAFRRALETGDDPDDAGGDDVGHEQADALLAMDLPPTTRALVQGMRDRMGKRGTKPAAAPVEVAPVAGVDGAQPLAATALNGAQVTSAVDIVKAYITGQLSRESAAAMLEVFFQLSAADAVRILGSAGFKPAPLTTPAAGSPVA